MSTPPPAIYDVVILGAGFDGLCQARHLLLNVPDLRVALVDCQTAAARAAEPAGIHEATVEIADLFLCRELRLHDYLIEHHTPRAALSFHWPKGEASATLADYYHVWANRQIPIASYQVCKAQFERDVLKMVRHQGAHYFAGELDDLAIVPGGELHRASVRIEGRHVELRARHLIDAAGRDFLTASRTDNLRREPEHIAGSDTGTAWLRVRGVDRALFAEGYDGSLDSSTSQYYSSNYFFGRGHWVWMIPTDMVADEVAIGIVHHRSVVPDAAVNTPDALLRFLDGNHELVARVARSGTLIDTGYLPQNAHTCERMFDPANWYAIGAAAFATDPFYQIGTTFLAFAVESVTALIRADLAGDTDLAAKRSAYNDFNLGYGYFIACLCRDHDRHLGHASVMSWRIYLDWMWWFGVNVPMYAGKWFLSLQFVPNYLREGYGNVDGLWMDLNEQFSDLVDRGANIGLMDCYRGDQLLGTYGTMTYFDDFLENAKFEPLRCNVFAGMKRNFFYAALWYLLLQWRGFSWKGLLRSRSWYHGLRLVWLGCKTTLVEAIVARKLRHLDKNSRVSAMRAEFASYRQPPPLRSLPTDVPVAARQR